MLFLSKRHGVGYISLYDEQAQRRTLSTRTRLNPDTLKVLQSFKQAEHERTTRLQQQFEQVRSECDLVFHERRHEEAQTKSTVTQNDY